VVRRLRALTLVPLALGTNSFDAVSKTFEGCIDIFSANSVLASDLTSLSWLTTNDW